MINTEDKHKEKFSTKKQLLSISGLVVSLLMIGDYFTSDENYIIPGGVKLVAGAGLLIYSVVRLLQNRQTRLSVTGEKNLLKIIFAFLFFAVVGSVWYFIHTSNNKARTHEDENGSFAVVLNGQTCFGAAKLRGNEEIIFQVKNVPRNVRIKEFVLFNKGESIDPKLILWSCALTPDFQVKRCSTQMDFEETFDLFIEKNIYTVMFSMHEPMENTKLTDISFRVVTEAGEQNISIVD